MDRPPREHTGLIIGLVVAFVAVLGLAYWVYREAQDLATPPPEFPLLADAPDPSLRGSVAYVDTEAMCVRVAPASGAEGKDVYCFGKVQLDEGPALAWLPDGRLEMVMYEWPPQEAIRPVWRKIVDVSTLEIEEASLDGVAPAPVPFVATPDGPNGERVTGTSEGGRIVVTIDSGATTRTLMDAAGNPEYQLTFAPMWSADGEWLLINDGRLLIATIAEPVSIRILAINPATFTSSGIPAVAVTAREFTVE